MNLFIDFNRPALRYAVLLFGLSIGAAMLSSCAKLSATMRVAPPVVEYGCNASANNNRCIVTLRDSVVAGPLAGQAVVRTDTVPVGVTRTYTISRTLSAGQVVVMQGSFEGLTATNKKAAPVIVRASGVYDPDADAAQPFLRIVIQ